jgi:deoxyhypusine synthase
MIGRKRMVNPFDIENRDLDTLVNLAESSYGGREALAAADVWLSMLEQKQITITLCVSGAPQTAPC